LWILFEAYMIDALKHPISMKAYIELNVF
jgi:hypothetical protein